PQDVATVPSTATRRPFTPVASGPSSVTVVEPGVRATASPSVPSSRASTTASRGGSAGGCAAASGGVAEAAARAAAAASFPGRSSVSTATATTTPQRSVTSAAADRRSRENASISTARFSQPSATSGTKSAVFTISVLPYDVDQIWLTADSSVRARPSPVSASTLTATSADVEKRRTADARTVGSSARGSTYTSESR